MKGFLALAANRLAAIDPAALRAPLVLLFTYDEEVGTLGARRFAETLRRRGRAAAERHHRRADRASRRACAQGDGAVPARVRGARGALGVPASGPERHRARGPRDRRLGRAAAARWKPSVRPTPSVSRPCRSPRSTSARCGRHGRERHPRPLRDPARHPAAARHDGERDRRARSSARCAKPSASRSRSSALSESPPMMLDAGRRRSIGTHVRGDRAARGRTASCSPPTPDGCSAPGSSACCSVPAASRWRTGPTSGCPSPSSAAPARCWTGSSAGAATASMSRVLDAGARLGGRPVRRPACRSPSECDGMIEAVGELGPRRRRAAARHRAASRVRRRPFPRVPARTPRPGGDLPARRRKLLDLARGDVRAGRVARPPRRCGS